MPDLIDLSKFNNSDFDRGAGRVKEFIWMLVRALFFQTRIPIPSRFRCALLKMFGAKVGKQVVIRSGVNITFPWRLEIGDCVWIGDEVFILSLARVKICDHVCVSQRAFLCTGSHDFSKKTFDLITNPITINSHSWIAAQAFIGPGTTIPEGTMVRAGQVVTRNSFKSIKKAS